MKSEDISALITQGRAYKSSSFLLKTLNLSHFPENLAPKKGSKIAFLASKKQFKTAVERNTARRRAKAALIKALGGTFKKLDKRDNFYVFSLNKAILKAKMADLTGEMEQVAQKSGML